MDNGMAVSHYLMKAEPDVCLFGGVHGVGPFFWFFLSYHSCVLRHHFYSRVGWLFFCESVLSGAGHRRRQLCGGLEPVGASSQLCFVLLSHFTPRPLRLTVPLAVLLIPPSAIICFDNLGGWRSSWQA